MLSSKKRFGVSIPLEVASKLDAIAVELGHDRSSIVAKAIEEYLHDEAHYEKEHACTGLVVLVNVQGIEVEPSDVVKASCSAKLRNNTVTVLFVEGSYSEIEKLRKKLARSAAFSRYIPLYCSFKPRKK